MNYRVGLEDNVEGRSMAWLLDFPGCFAYGLDGEAAIMAAANALHEYAAWVVGHGGECRIRLEQINIVLEESWEVYDIDQDFNRVAQGYSVNAWFLDDWKPLTVEQVGWGLQLLAWSRQDLLAAVQGLSEEKLQETYPSERWSISGILRHVGGAEWWYLDRLGIAQPRETISEEPFERLEQVRGRLVEVLPSLIGLAQIVGVEGELWSPRKLLRRAVWHERDHTSHIHKLT